MYVTYGYIKNKAKQFEYILTNILSLNIEFANPCHSR